MTNLPPTLDQAERIIAKRTAAKMFLLVALLLAAVMVIQPFLEMGYMYMRSENAYRRISYPSHTFLEWLGNNAFMLAETKALLVSGLLFLPMAALVGYFAGPSLLCVGKKYLWKGIRSYLLVGVWGWVIFNGARFLFLNLAVPNFKGWFMRGFVDRAIFSCVLLAIASMVAGVLASYLTRILTKRRLRKLHPIAFSNH